MDKPAAVSDIVGRLPKEQSLSAKPRPYTNHSVEFKKPFTARQRTKVLQSVGWNVFFYPAEMVTGCDLLSDSGTTTMTNEQWAALHLGDEAYGSNRGYFLLRERVRETFGEAFAPTKSLAYPTVFLFHQGRPVEDALFSLLGKIAKHQIIPSNGHFDTTAANVEAHGIKAVNLFSPTLKDPASTDAFKGNMDVARLKILLKKNRSRIPVVFLTITNNTGGGQPVSLANMREVASVCRQARISLFFDACRFAENAWFIKTNEPGYSQKSVAAIVQEMFSLVDGFTISFKKDGLANMGGGLFLRAGGQFVKRYPELPDELLNLQIIKEGHPTYGGMSGRDIMALTVGLQTVLRTEYLKHRVGQVQAFGQAMAEQGLPVMTPIGGHAVYLDMNRFFEGTKMKPTDFGGIAFTAILLAAYGHRAVELGNFAFGSYNSRTKKEVLAEVNFVRFAVPRLRYEQQDLESVVAATKALHDHRERIPAIRVVSGRDLPLRHFKARFAFKHR